MSDLAALITLARLRRRAAMVLWIERLAPCLAPAAALLAAFACVVVLGGLTTLAPWPRLALLLAILAAAVMLVGRGLRHLAPPDATQIDRRLERGARDPHRTLLTLQDQPAFAGADVVWHAHRQRALAQIGTLRPGPPRLGPLVPAATLAAIALLVSSWLAGPLLSARLIGTLLPLPAWPGPAIPAIQAWIVPPPYHRPGPDLPAPEPGRPAHRPNRLDTDPGGARRQTPT